MIRRKSSKKPMLFILDPLSMLDLAMDTSLGLIRELDERGHKIYAADSHDFYYQDGRIYASARVMKPSKFPRFQFGPVKQMPVSKFDFICLRKEPPFDESYLYLTYLLEHASKEVPVWNSPIGIRNNNEKLSSIHFGQWMPKTIVTKKTSAVISFQKKIKADLVLKPLNERAGNGILLLKKNTRSAKKIIQKVSKQENDFIMAQQFLDSEKHPEKRIIVLDGKILAVYGKKAAKGDFRANLHKGGSYYPAECTKTDRQLVRDMKSYLMKEGLYFVGLDVMGPYLIEVNVTCPGALLETQAMYPELRLLGAVVDSLEDFSQKAKG